jgi:hypothetical protein
LFVPPLLDAAGRRRSPASLPGYLAGRPPRNKGLGSAPDPLTVGEIVAVMPQAGDGRHGARLRALIVPLCRAGLRRLPVDEAPALSGVPQCSSWTRFELIVGRSRRPDPASGRGPALIGRCAVPRPRGSGRSAGS